MTEKTVQKYYLKIVETIHLLLDEVLPAIENINNKAIFTLSLDGTHCPIEEPKPFSAIWSSHKFGKDAGLAYEVGL